MRLTVRLMWGADLRRSSRFQRMRDIRNRQRNPGAAAVGGGPSHILSPLAVGRTGDAMESQIPRGIDGTPLNRVVGFDACSTFDEPWEVAEVRDPAMRFLCSTTAIAYGNV